MGGGGLLLTELKNVFQNKFHCSARSYMAISLFYASEHCEKSNSFQYKLEGGLYLGGLFWCTGRWAYNWLGGGLKVGEGA